MDRDKALDVRQRFPRRPSDGSGGPAARTTDAVVIKEKETNSKCSDDFIDTCGNGIAAFSAEKKAVVIEESRFSVEILRCR
ncbi:MAG TPA: hypothetical protein VG077_14340 [Verrucomicrobiae bacterium]|nr:hypothetical protein [Verrucomicrobiae bacterium]